MQHLYYCHSTISKFHNYCPIWERGRAIGFIDDWQLYTVFLIYGFAFFLKKYCYLIIFWSWGNPWGGPSIPKNWSQTYLYFEHGPLPLLRVELYRASIKYCILQFYLLNGGDLWSLELYHEHFLKYSLINSCISHYKQIKNRVSFLKFFNFTKW